MKTENANLTSFTVRTLTEEELCLLCSEGLVRPKEAHLILGRLLRNGRFESPLSPERRQLLAVLTRAAGLRPWLVVDNA